MIPIPYVIEKTGRGERAYDIYSRLLEDRIIFIGSAIDDTVANVVIAQLLFLQRDNRHQDIQVYINSPGGYVTSGLAIYDTMQFVQPQVATYCLGQASSMGSVLLAAGAKGKRFALPHSRIMIHQPWGGAEGTAADISIHAKEILKLKANLSGILARHTGQTPERIDEDSDRDHFLSADEAKEYGLVDEVIESLKEVKPDDPEDGAESEAATIEAAAGGAAIVSPRDASIEKCTFCGKTRHLVESLIAGPPHIYICNECVELCNTILLEEDRRGGAKVSPAAVSRESLPTPREIKERLDEYVISQEHAKRVISVAVHNHYKRLASEVDSDEVEIEKSNILLLGPTGSGKTLIARTLARILDVPFAIGDATTLTEAGYVGEDVENLILKLLHAAEWDRERAERGIIFIDEIDKIGRTTMNVSITRDVSGEGVQQSLLKMLEGTIANVPPQGGRKHPEQSYIQIDTTNILFICGGTFSGIEELIRRRTGEKSIGFEAGPEGAEAVGAILDDVEPQDLLEFGLIPEFVGRLPVIGSLHPLSVDDLVRIMMEPKNAVVRQYQKFFEMEGAEISFTDEALREIAERALKKETGVRAVRAILEDLLLDALFDLPEVGRDKSYVLTEEVVTGDASLLPTLSDSALADGAAADKAAGDKATGGKAGTRKKGARKNGKKRESA